MNTHLHIMQYENLLHSECTENIEVMRFDKIMPSLKNEEVDGGLVIHEGRFTFNQYNLTKVTDLGVEWESNYNLPIPLGFIHFLMKA